MSKTTPEAGLIVAGDAITDVATALQLLKDAGTESDIAALSSPLVTEMIEAMQSASTAHIFHVSKGFLENIRFRMAAIAAMANMNTGAFDCDYFNSDIGLKTRLGTTDSTRVSPYWQFIAPTDDYDSDWVQVADTQASVAVKPAAGSTFPFRGECAGAFQLAVYWGLLDGLGATVFDGMAATFGTMYVGPWHPSPATNPATTFMVSAPLTDAPIPGDYMYFKNKDDYSTLAPNGFWTGLNSMYMGKDMLGTGHYSGMGASWLSESNLRMSVANAYYHDCYPHTIAHPLTEVRFTERCVLQIPANLEPSSMSVSAHDASTTNAPQESVLLGAGYTQGENGALSHANTTVGALAETLNVPASALRQMPSAGLSNTIHRVKLHDATAVVQFHAGQPAPHDPNAAISVHIVPNSKA